MPHAVIKPTVKQRLRLLERTDRIVRVPHLVVSDRYQWVPYAAPKPNDFLAIGFIKPANRFFNVSREIAAAGNVAVYAVEHIRVLVLFLVQYVRRS